MSYQRAVHTNSNNEDTGQLRCRASGQAFQQALHLGKAGDQIVISGLNPLRGRPRCSPHLGSWGNVSTVVARHCFPLLIIGPVCDYWLLFAFWQTLVCSLSCLWLHCCFGDVVDSLAVMFHCFDSIRPLFFGRWTASAVPQLQRHDIKNIQTSTFPSRKLLILL